MSLAMEVRWIDEVIIAMVAGSLPIRMVDNDVLLLQAR